MKLINFKISCEHTFPRENIAHVRLRKGFAISMQTFEIPDFVPFQSSGNCFLFSELVRSLLHISPHIGFHCTLCDH